MYELLTTERTKCIICGEEERTAISILEHNICQKCETEIIHTTIDEPIYSFFLDKLKLINMKK